MDYIINWFQEYRLVIDAYVTVIGLSVTSLMFFYLMVYRLVHRRKK